MRGRGRGRGRGRKGEGTNDAEVAVDAEVAEVVQQDGEARANEEGADVGETKDDSNGTRKLSLRADSAVPHFLNIYSFFLIFCSVFNLYFMYISFESLHNRCSFARDAKSCARIGTE